MGHMAQQVWMGHGLWVNNSDPLTHN